MSELDKAKREIERLKQKLERKDELIIELAMEKGRLEVEMFALKEHYAHHSASRVLR